MLLPSRCDLAAGHPRLAAFALVAAATLAGGAALFRMTRCRLSRPG